ncbi:MAG TPA: FAD-binding oxidoreductase [Acidimicrobiales bacterium]|nr:FAD-binding oxidoreductase [Acidimicrobiales bacterium]
MTPTRAPAPVAGSAAPPARRLVTGFGRAAGSVATLHEARTARDVERVVADARAAGGRVLARGLGRAYGDAAQCAGGELVDCTPMARLLELDSEHGVARAEGGYSIASLLRTCVPRGWFVPVTPGTRHVTLGGAVAADVHGKNHHRDGSFGGHVVGLEVVGASGSVRVGPGLDPERYWATAGGMGLTGVVTEVSVKLRPIATSRLAVTTERAPDLDACMARLTELDADHGYTVAWVDGLAGGGRLGRSVITAGDHAALDDLPAAMRADPLAYDPRTPLSVPVAPPVSLVGRATLRAFNEAWYRRAPRRRVGEIQSIAQFFHPLDAVRDWNRLYGPRGFTQYQLVVPFSGADVVRRTLELLQRAHVLPALCVLKSFGSASEAPMSFPMPGWTLAADLPLGSPALAGVLDEIDGVVAGAGGRVYLAKDGRLRPELLSTMYPRVAEWRAVCERHDPERLFVSDLWRRVAAVA